MSDWQPSWTECLTVARLASDHYSMTERQQELLYEIALGQLGKEAVIVELGVCNGKTAAVLAYCAKAKHGAYVGIDNWSLEGSRDEVAAVLEAVNRFARSGAPAAFTLMQQSTHTALVAGQIDMLVIDAGHDEANVGPDCRIWIPQVRPGGLVVFHDYDGKWDAESCHAAVRKWADRYTGDWERLAYWFGLHVVRKPQ